MRNRNVTAWLLAAAATAGLLTGCAGETPPVCQDLAAVSDIGGIGLVLEGIAAPDYDYAAATMQAEGVVRESCPDELWKLDRYREQVINPVTGGG